MREVILNKLKKILLNFKNKNLYLSFFITLVFFGIFIKLDFATDTYIDFVEPARKMFYSFINSGRFITAICIGVVHVLHFSDALICFFSYSLAIICITFSIYNLYLVIHKKVENEVLCLLVSILIIINPFSIELFLFLEKGVFAFAVLLSVLAFINFTKYLEGNKKTIKFIFLFMLIAVFSYQGVVGLFVGLSVVYIVFYSKNIKEFIKNNVIVLLGYGVPAIINLLLVRIFFNNDRVNGAIIFNESIEKVINGLKEMFQTYYIMPKNNLLIILILVTILALIMIVINKKDKIKSKILKILGLGYIALSIIGVTIVPQLMQNTANIWFVPRSTYPFGAIIGIFMMYIILNLKGINIFSNKSNTISISSLFIMIIAVIELFIQLYSFNKIEIEHYNVNYNDKINSLVIGEEIIKYEKETGNKVTKICVYQDKYVSQTYPYLSAIKDINVSGFYPTWSVASMINYYNNINLEEIKKDNKIQEIFSEYDWNNFNKEQILFIGDTLHYCKF